MYGVYNVFINSFYLSCLFLLGIMLLQIFKKFIDEKYLFEDVFNYMLFISVDEFSIYRIYYIVKMC